jgi:hypothetical protein
MRMKNEDAIDRAIKGLHPRRLARLPDREVIVACLIRTDDWKPLKAPWWKKKEASIIGVDTSGNFFLQHCDGSVRYWDHKAQSDTTIAPSVEAFCLGLEDTSLHP